MWTPTTRQQHSRPVRRYQTNLTDAEWRVIVPHLPKPCATGWPREWPMREIINGVFYVVRGAARDGCCRTTCHHGGRFTAGSPFASVYLLSSIVTARPAGLCALERIGRRRRQKMLTQTLRQMEHDGLITNYDVTAGHSPR
jgi:hypothetical protein